MEINLDELTQFLFNAVLNTYVGNGKEVEPWNPGFKELEYPEGGWPGAEWYYRDSYCGFYRAPGREVVYHKGVPIWSRWYDGGMEPEYRGKVQFAKTTFQFLKRALRGVDPLRPFQRGPSLLKASNWKYESKTEGNIFSFRGWERIYYMERLVFAQEYGGGLIIPKS